MSGAPTITGARREDPAGHTRTAAGCAPRHFDEPSRALADPVQFLAHLMVFGTVEDLAALRGIIGKDDYREVLEHAPPGIFDVRSWAYWNLVCDRRPTPPLPARTAIEGASP
jgi:hypothetical protein